MKISTLSLSHSIFFKYIYDDDDDEVKKVLEECLKNLYSLSVNVLSDLSEMISQLTVSFFFTWNFFGIFSKIFILYSFSKF